MAYGDKYICQFDGLDGRIYTFTIKAKGYSGSTYRLTGASSPCVQSWPDDSPTSAIKGCSLNFTFINENGVTPITSFYTNDDDMYMGVLESSTGETLFNGFLVLDDSTETLVDYNHEVNLSFTDNLGLLKDIKFNNAIDTSVAKYTLTDIIAGCLEQTNLKIDFNLYAQVHELSQSFTQGFIDYTYLDINTFSDDNNNYDSCYDVLDKIFTSFGCTCFYAKGRWNICRFGELSNINFDNTYTFYGYSYTHRGGFQGIVNDFGDAIIGINQDIQFTEGLLSKVNRPIEFSKKTLDFKNTSTLYNSDLQKLGALLSQYTSGSDTIKEYAFDGWQRGHLPGGTGNYWPSNTIQYFFIRVIYDADGIEYQRYAVVKGTTNDSASCIEGKYIDVTKGDSINLSFSFKTYNSAPLPATFIFDVKLINQLPPTAPIADHRRYLAYSNNPAYSGNNGQWKTSRNFSFQVNIGNTADWQNVSVESIQIPFNGQVIVSLAQCDDQSAETHYKDIKFSVKQNINLISLITGQYNQTSQPTVIKKNIDEKIYVDDTPRNSIKGTLLLPTITNLIHDRTNYWIEKSYSTYTHNVSLNMQLLQATIFGGVGTPFAIGKYIQFTKCYGITGFPPDFPLYAMKITNVQQINASDILLTLDGNQIAHIFGFQMDYNLYLYKPSKLSELQTLNDLMMLYNQRIVLEGSTFGIYDNLNANTISMAQKVYYTYFSVKQPYFIWGKLEIDYRNIKATGTLYEVYNNTDDKRTIAKTYKFDYIFNNK